MSFTDTSIHLKPLSSYSKMVCSKQQSASPCFKIQVHISDKTRGFKRRLQDSCFEDISETPLKKPCLISSNSPDEGCFSLEYQESSPFQKLIISKPVTPPRSTVNQPVTLFTSTPMSKLANDQIGQDRERLPSPIPILQWDRVVPSADFLRMPLNFDFFSTVPSLASEGTVKFTVEDVSEKHSPVHESKAQVVPSEIVLPPEEEETSCKNVESTAESFESTLPLLVQVKSKVVVPEYFNQEEWESKKRAYVDSVKKHMTEQNGVMKELHSLMNSVANLTSGKTGQQWQHPSDLSKRNYKLSKSGLKMSLEEWERKNQRSYRRFANVPDFFQRSPVL